VENEVILLVIAASQAEEEITPVVQIDTAAVDLDQGLQGETLVTAGAAEGGQEAAAVLAPDLHAEAHPLAAAVHLARVLLQERGVANLLQEEEEANLLPLAPLPPLPKTKNQTETNLLANLQQKEVHLLEEAPHLEEAPRALPDEALLQNNDLT